MVTSLLESRYCSYLPLGSRSPDRWLTHLYHVNGVATLSSQADRLASGWLGAFMLTSELHLNRLARIYCSNLSEC